MRGGARLGAVLLTAVSLGLAGSGTMGAGAPAAAAAATCRGLPVTIDGTANTAITGTAGNDVIVAPFGTSGSVDARGGDDVICVVDGPEIASADGPEYVVLAGAGDDIVDSTALSADKHGFAVSASAGSDSFFGGPADEQLTLGADPQQVQMGGGDDVVRNVFPDIPEGQVAGGLGEDLLQIDVHGQIVADLDLEVMVKDHGRRTHLAVSGFEDADVSARRGFLLGTGADNGLFLQTSGFAFVAGHHGDDDLRIGVRSGTPAFPNAGREAHGGGGDDVLRGSFLDDELGGGTGTDTAFGHDGRDICDAEVRVDCEAR